MSIYAIVWAYEQDVPHQGAKFTLVTAAQYANDEGICWVKQETMARDMSCERRTVMRHLEKLENSFGLIERVSRRRKDGTRASDLIKLIGFSKVTKNDPGAHQGDNLSQQETSVIPSDTLVSSGRTNPPQWDQASIGQKQAYFISYLHQRITERGLESPSPAYKQQLSGEARHFITNGRAKADLLFALDHIVARWEDKKLTLWQAMDDVDGRNKRGSLRAVKDPTPPEAMRAICEDPDLARYAETCNVWDYTRPQDPPWQILARLGGTDQERQQHLQWLQQTARRAVAGAAV